jgi:hypothetical protein
VALAGRVATLDAILLALCNVLGDEEVRTAIQPVMPRDKMVEVCFSSGNSDPRQALKSYLDHLKRETAPLVLWDPSTEGT